MSVKNQFIVVDGKVKLDETNIKLYLDAAIDFWRRSDRIYADPSSNISKPNFDAQFKIRNDGAKPIEVERLSLAIHDSNNNYLWDMVDPTFVIVWAVGRMAERCTRSRRYSECASSVGGAATWGDTGTRGASSGTTQGSV